MSDFYLKFIPNPPYRGDSPCAVILYLFSEPFDMYVNRAGVSGVVIPPYVFQKLFSGKYLIWRGSQKIQKLQFFGRHFHGVSHVDDGIIGEINRQIRIFHIFAPLPAGIGSLGSRRHKGAAQHGLYPSHQLFGVKGLDHIVVGPQLQSQYLVKYLPFCRQHNDRDLGIPADLPAYLIAVDARQHQV